MIGNLIYISCITFTELYIYFAGLSFVGLTKNLLSQGYSYVLTEKILCQDNVEQYFGLQRRSCGTNQAPTLADYTNNERKMSVVREIQLPTKRGNCRGGVAKQTLEIDSTPLPTKRSKR